MKSHCHEYSFDDWVLLSGREKRRITRQEWDPATPQLGELTRAAILDGFAVEHSYLMGKAIAGTAFFSRAGWCIGVVVADTRVKVPKRFDIFPVVKGVTSDPDDPWRSAKWVAK